MLLASSGLGEGKLSGQSTYKARWTGVNVLMVV